ncbi:class I SAM-dependent methyltransferase [Bradyrhizobium sp. IC3195]|uniref:class I SAM-dependent methyltransferase n=1 Tax=Bradyrhizobium sp. IC3195 TaxID=2793804 RepID=UPI001CD7E117|nr:class I SAM-dependent methyltransferase [Bradyrhizobium sp. IC3195]MCA1467125.1 class I SAM-dependent methyltransferase [Bradyrhizobium sp. IC3195]
MMTKLWEARSLYDWHATNAVTRVKQVIEIMDAVEDTIRSRYDLALTDLTVLDVGTGQQQIQSAWLARRNRVIGIDLDVVAKGWSPRGFLTMWRVNGAYRTVKTLARKALRLDAMYARALHQELGRGAEDIPVYQMDVAAMGFPSHSFDFVYCSSVLQCVPDVNLALHEMNRVLVPGGVGYFTVQLYTSETGSLDPRLYSGDRSSIPYWAHLRPAECQRVSGNAWLNKMRLSEWRQCVDACLPNPIVKLSQPQAHTLLAIAQSLQERGHLQEYSLEELVTHELQVSWRK